MFFLADSPVRMNLFFAGFKGVLWVWFMRSCNVTGWAYGIVPLVYQRLINSSTQLPFGPRLIPKNCILAGSWKESTGFTAFKPLYTACTGANRVEDVFMWSFGTETEQFITRVIITKRIKLSSNAWLSTLWLNREGIVSSPRRQLYKNTEEKEEESDLRKYVGAGDLYVHERILYCIITSKRALDVCTTTRDPVRLCLNIGYRIQANDWKRASVCPMLSISVQKFVVKHMNPYWKSLSGGEI
jgi:hypothetical protein